MADFNMTRLSSLMIDPTLNTDKTTNGCWLPSISTVDRASISANLIAGIPTVSAPIIYNSTTVTYQIYSTRSNSWENVVTSPSTVTGVGLASGSPLVLPSGPAVAVEVAANEVNGFMYYNTTGNTVKVRRNNAWVTVQTV